MLLGLLAFNIKAGEVYDLALAGLTEEEKRALVKGLNAIIANLFLHHFEDDTLARLFALAASRTTLLVACEPRRARLPLAGSHLLGVIGCNDVTRHDAVLSVRSGFIARELSALWPLDRGWSLEERRAGPFSHLFVARLAEHSP